MTAVWGDCPECGETLTYDDIGDIESPACEVCHTPLDDDEVA